VSIFVIGVWFWASLFLSAAVLSIAAALIVSLTTRVAPALGAQLGAWQDNCRAAVAFQEPLPSSPSHRSYRHPL